MLYFYLPFCCIANYINCCSFIYRLQIIGANNSNIHQRYIELCNQLDSLLNRKIGIYSLSKSNVDELMWSHYGYSHKGFCLGYDLNILTKNQSIRKYYAFPVKYSRVPPQVTIDDIINLNIDLTKNSLIRKFTSIKSRKWSNEEEIRIISDNCGLQSYDFRALKSICFGLKMDPTQKELIMSTMKGRGIKYYQMELKNNSYEFYSIPVEDMFPDSPPYLYKISTVEKEAVLEEEVNKKYKKYIPYLYKAIEIARRDPYCKHVYYAEFSDSRSKPNDPVIFVNCDKSNDDYDNLYYHIYDIEALYSKIQDI